MTIPTHEVSVNITGKKIAGWKSYTIESDILQPADSFDLSLKFSTQAWDLCRTDAPIAVFIDQVRILSGFIGSRKKVPGEGGTELQIAGRDQSGRLVDESSSLFSYGGLGIKELAERIVGIGQADSMFTKVTLVNTRNRNLLRKTTARQAKVVREPVPPGTDLYRKGKGPLITFFGDVVTTTAAGRTIVTGTIARPPKITPGIFKGRSVKKKVTPGQSRWAVLEEFLKEARLLAWSTGDGRELFIGIPNFEQQPQYAFYEASADSASRSRTNASITVEENVEELYSMYTVVGASRGGSANYGKDVTKNRAVIYDNPLNETDGTGARFLRRKALLITDDGIKNQRDALERAEREQQEREINFSVITVNVPGHSQLYAGETSAIYAVDTMARVWDEDTRTKGKYFVTRCTYTGSVAGTTTELSLVPEGTLLQL